jgi:hypothetical protein
MALGDVVCAWLLLRGAEVAARLKLSGDAGNDKAYYEGKVAAAKWFAQLNLLAKITAELRIAETANLAIMDLDEAAF